MKIKIQPFDGCEKYNLEKIFTIKAVENGEEVQAMDIPIKDAEPMTLFVKAHVPELEVSTDISATLEIQVD